MGTIANKINKVKNTKDKIKTITNLSTLNAITLETVFKDYPKQILKEYVKIINNGTDELYTNFPKVEDEGAKLELDTERGPLKITLEGNISQDGEPTPETPVSIKVVTGEQNIETNGKNKFNLYNHTNTLDNNTVIIDSNKYICNTATTWRGRIILKLENLESNTNYTFSYNSNNPRSIISRIIGIKEGTSTNLITNYYYAYTNKATFNTNDYDSITIDIYATGNGNTITNTTISNLQLEEGTKANNFEPYYESQTYSISLGNIELCKINDYKDYIFKNEITSAYYNAELKENSWYKHKRFVKVVLDETKTYNTRINSSNNNQIYCSTGISNVFSESQICNYGKFLTTTYNWGKYGNFSILNASGHPFHINVSNNETVETWKAKMAIKNLICYAPLSTPIYEEITDETLISQLENINNNAKSYSGTTIIECSSSIDDNETIQVSAIALKNIN